MASPKEIELHQKMIADKKIPDVLYKHTSISNNLRDSLAGGYIYFPSPTSFNDPFDCQINDQTNWTDDLILDFVTRTATTNGEPINPQDVVRANQQHPGSFATFFTGHFRNTLSRLGVTCFLPNPDNLLLWAHYSDSHKGLCLKFDITQDPAFFSGTFAVKYSPTYPVFDYLTERSNLVNKAVLTKSDHWAYEKEVRTLQKTSGAHTFNKAALQEIIFGCKTPQTQIDEIREIIRVAGYPNVQFKQVKLRQFQYNIDILPI